MTGIERHGEGGYHFCQPDKTDRKGIISEFINPPSDKGTHHAQGHDKKKSPYDQIFIFRNLYRCKGVICYLGNRFIFIHTNDCKDTCTFASTKM